jgi:hypothetical protein
VSTWRSERRGNKRPLMWRNGLGALRHMEASTGVAAILREASQPNILDFGGKLINRFLQDFSIKTFYSYKGHRFKILPK